VKQILNITQKCIDQLKIISDKHLPNIEISPEHNWKNKSNDDLWLDVFKQVVVVGNSRPVASGKIDKYEQTIAYAKLKNENNAREIIHKVLREIGAMWVGDDIDKDVKAKCLSKNLNYFKHYQNEVKGFFTYVAGLDEKARIRYAAKQLEYIGDKSARDLLMELGLIRNSIALDVRIVKSLRNLGVNIPDNYNDKKIYPEIEKEILENICKPLDLEGVELDRLLYNTYKR
jgi:hypothetical protein